MFSAPSIHTPSALLQTNIPALPKNSESQRQQNKGMRIILGAPRWTRLVTLLLESNLGSRKMRYNKLQLIMLQKPLLCSHDISSFITTLRQHSHAQTTSSPRPRWQNKISSIETLNVRPAVKARGVDTAQTFHSSCIMEPASSFLRHGYAPLCQSSLLSN